MEEEDISYPKACILLVEVIFLLPEVNKIWVVDKS